MRAHIATAFLGALLFGAATLLLTTGPAHAQLTITSEALAAPVQEAQAAAAANNWTNAIAAMRRAEQVPGITGQERAFIQQSLLAYMVSARQYQQALTQVERMIAGGIGNRNQNLESALRLSLNLNNTAKAEEYARQLGRPGDIAIFSAQAAYDRGDNQECIRLATPLGNVGRPPEGVLELLSACYFAIGDNEALIGQRRILELVALHYPSPETWDALTRNVRRTVPGMTDEQQLEIHRLRLLTGNFTQATDYSGMAELDLVVMFPGEAKRVMELAAEAELLQGERSTRLMTLVDERIVTHRGQMEGANPAGDATGFIALRVGLARLSYEEFPAAEELLRSAIDKGVTGANLQMAQIGLGRALLGQDMGPEAVEQFNAVQGYADNNAYAVIARMWSIYARNP